MGNVCCRKRKEKKKIVLLLVGLDNAGKTVAAKGLVREPIDDVVPTVGFHTVQLSYKNFIVKIYDLGGAVNFRGIWHKYFVDAYGIIFVIDSSDFERLDEAKEVLKSVLSHDKVSGKPLLFLANKQDSENALDEIDLHEKFDLEDIVNTYQCPTVIECCSATDSNKKKIDSGIIKGFKWLMNFIETNYEGLNTRVITDTAQQEQLENSLRDEIIKRIQNARKNEEIHDEDAIELYSEYTRKLKELENNIHNGNCFKQMKQVSENSLEDFPPIYYGTTPNHKIQRPKSAREFVKDQLRLNCNGITTKRNKTLPIHVIGINLPHSARERSQTCEIPRRILKSAGDVKMSVHLPNMVFPKDKIDYCERTLDLDHFSKTCHFLPLDIRPKVRIQNGISCSKSDDNDISFISIS
ncbi:hypothetical protein WA026_016381 [Henosepilachna vigintioctopunctata]|uniref:ADP-ribosylation factor-like protein 13B n=1 Tax=Henosepilachna vigintioctopunctata TaxID=420089 RepID=A0AAW1UFN1_9CUCU